ncbi:MAG: hypothetical protein ABR526_07495 [Chthoniobacterales bacterium]
MIKLVCPECRRENEPARIYCHDCGARLDRSALAKAQASAEDPAATHKRVKALFDGRNAKMRARFFQISKLVLSALGAAVVIQMLRPPDLPAVAKAEMLPRQINLDLESAAMDPRSPGLRYSKAEVNAYLGYALKSKKTALSKVLQFENAVVELGEGFYNLTVERSLFGFSVFTTGSFVPTLQNGVFANNTRGGHLGRLPLHPALMNLVAPYLFGDLASVAERERKSISKLSGVEIHPQTLIFGPHQP